MNYQDRIPDKNGTWENEIDLKHENELKELVEKKWFCSLIKQAPKDPMDFFAIRDEKTIAWVEMRSRNCLSTSYSEIFLGKEKFKKLRDACRCLEIPAIFVIRFNDHVCFIDLTKVERPNETYANRGDIKVKRVTDNEKAVLLPVKNMSII